MGSKTLAIFVFFMLMGMMMARRHYATRYEKCELLSLSNDSNEGEGGTLDTCLVCMIFTSGKDTCFTCSISRSVSKSTFFISFLIVQKNLQIGPSKGPKII